MAQRRLAVVSHLKGTQLIIADPTQDLAHARMEGELLARASDFAPVELLSGGDATWTAVSKSFMRARHLHFACHGLYEWRDPLRSALILAGLGQEGRSGTGYLRLLELVNARDSTVGRLVTMSACETGITDVRELPDEFIGLTSGWLRAGFPGVISTLWKVDDLSTMLVKVRFYI